MSVFARCCCQRRVGCRKASTNTWLLLCQLMKERQLQPQLHLLLITSDLPMKTATTGNGSCNKAAAPDVRQAFARNVPPNLKGHNVPWRRAVTVMVPTV